MLQPIGGYFELELSDRGTYPHSGCIHVNSGRNALELILRLQERMPSKVYIPHFTCDTVFQPLERLEIPYEFYHINDKLELSDDIQLATNEYIVVNNYFGLQDGYIKQIYARYGNQLIIDCTQAWYTPDLTECKMFYSPRKFFGLPDGGIAHTPLNKKFELEDDISYTRCEHLLRRIDEGATEGYDAFQLNSEKLSAVPLRKMSRLTKAILASIDHETVKTLRIKNYEYLHSKLKDINQFEAPDPTVFALSGCPMIYPLMTEYPDLRHKLIKNNIFVATYWPNVLELCNHNSLEYRLAKNMIPIPIDQRYGQSDMDRILNIIYG